MGCHRHVGKQDPWLLLWEECLAVSTTTSSSLLDWDQYNGNGCTMLPASCDQDSYLAYPESRVSFDLPRQIWNTKETLRAASRFFDPQLTAENGWVSQVFCLSNRFFTDVHDHSQKLMTIFMPMLRDNGHCFAFIQSHWKSSEICATES